MKLYVAVTGFAFVLLFLAHVARVVMEGWHVATGGMFVVTSLLSLAISIWAAVLYLGIKRSSKL